MSLKQLGAVALMSVLIVSISALLTFVRDQVFAQGYAGAGSSVLTVPVEAPPPGWLGSFTVLEQKGVKQVVLVDPVSKRIGVYEVSLADNGIRFCSMRELNADFQLRVYNGVEPLPQQIEQNFRSN